MAGISGRSRAVPAAPLAADFTSSGVAPDTFCLSSSALAETACLRSSTLSLARPLTSAL